MYNELVRELRNCATEAAPCKTCERIVDGSCSDTMMKQAADAIEEMQQQVVEYQLALDGANDKIAYALGKDYGYDLEYGRQRWCDTVNDLKAAVPKWISVEERLPPSDDLVIVAIHDDSGDTSYDVTNVGFYLKLEYGGAWVVENERCNYVTHWMPLPEPPKEET